MAPKTKINLKERLEDGELDLSLSELQEVPVREIAAMKKATSLDLSNNRLTTLGKNFITLTNIIKLDLGKNLLTELPEDFGEMKQLKHLDLYHNQLTHLPLSFYKLKGLRWLDLKNNPLVPAVAKVAGPCLDQQHCTQCAKNIVNFFTQMNEQIEEEKIRREHEKQAELEVEMANQKKQQKKKEKNKALKVKKNKIKAERKLESINVIEEPFIDYVKEPVVKNGRTKSIKVQKSRSGCFIKKLFYVIILSSVSLFIYTTLKSECALNLKQKTIEIWGNLVSSAPVTWHPWTEKFAIHVENAHNITGKVVENTVEYLQEISKNEKVQNGLEILSGTWNLAYFEVKKILVVLSEQTIVLKNEIKRIFDENF